MKYKVGSRKPVTWEEYAAQKPSWFRKRDKNLEEYGA